MHIDAGMSKAESKTQRKKHVIIQKTKICNYSTARYLYENALATEPEQSRSRSWFNRAHYFNENALAMARSQYYYNRSPYSNDNDFSREPEYSLWVSRSFRNSVKYQLPTRYIKEAYMTFINKWGTVCWIIISKLLILLFNLHNYFIRHIIIIIISFPFQW